MDAFKERLNCIQLSFLLLKLFPLAAISFGHYGLNPTLFQLTSETELTSGTNSLPLAIHNAKRDLLNQICEAHGAVKDNTRKKTSMIASILTGDVHELGGKW